MTLPELLIAGTILVLVGGAMATLAFAVHSSHEVCRNRSIAAQHARVAVDRIERAVEKAYASERFPAFHVVEWPINGFWFPDALAVWRPNGTPADPAGLPRVSELVVFAPDNAAPYRLLEMTWPTNHDPAPDPSLPLSWRTLIDSFQASTETVKNQLTDRLMTGNVDLTELVNAGQATRRGKIRFRQQIAPSAAQWSEYRSGLRSWKNLDWPLDLYGSQTGMRTVVLKLELQIHRGTQTQPDPIPFFGSAVVNYTLNR
jgi:hypothetical protein